MSPEEHVRMYRAQQARNFYAMWHEEMTEIAQPQVVEWNSPMARRYRHLVECAGCSCDGNVTVN